MTATTAIPEHLLQDRYWKPLLYLFSHHPKLNECFTARYIDLHEERVHVEKLKRDSSKWSRSEKAMLKLALQCFNDSAKFDLGELGHMDSVNHALAMEAIHMRYGR